MDKSRAYVVASEGLHFIKENKGYKINGQQVMQIQAKHVDIIKELHDITGNNYSVLVAGLIELGIKKLKELE